MTPAYLICSISYFLPALLSIPSQTQQNSCRYPNMQSFFTSLHFYRCYFPIVWNYFLPSPANRAYSSLECISAFTFSVKAFASSTSISWMYHFLLCNHTAVFTYLFIAHYTFSQILGFLLSLSPPADYAPWSQMKIFLFCQSGLVYNITEWLNIWLLT